VKKPGHVPNGKGKGQLSSTGVTPGLSNRVTRNPVEGEGGENVEEFDDFMKGKGEHI